MAKKSKSLDCISSDKRWKVERDLETLMECEKIENDPDRMKLVKALAQEKMMAVAAIAAEGKD